MEGKERKDEALLKVGVVRGFRKKLLTMPGRGESDLIFRLFQRAV